MRHRAFILAAIAAASATTASAQPIDPCSLLSEADLIELGLSKDAVPAHESQPGGVQACRYQFRSAGANSVGTVSVILSQAVPERAMQLRALQAKAREENTPAQLQARNEYADDKATCKVVSVARQETSQCIGATEQSVVALAVSRPNLADKVAYPAAQLRIIATLVSRVGLKGG